MIHQITHPNELVKKKVNFFADYFDFVATYIGIEDTLEVENPLSLIEKIIFQIDNNPHHCHKYINSYLAHPLLSRDNEDLKDIKVFEEVSRLFAFYINLQKPQKKITWIQETPSFRASLIRLKRSLQRRMFKAALKCIISYLNCVHDIPTHKKHLKDLTKLLVTEFVLNDRSKKDLKKTFQKILSREVWEFPFPSSMAKESKETKEAFIQNRTFQQQFDGIYNLLRAPLNKSFLVFRVHGLVTPDNFSFTYNKVTFYNFKHTKLTTLLENLKNDRLIKDFFASSNGLLLAVIKAEYFSMDVAVNEAVSEVKNEVSFINRLFKINATLEPFSYLVTTDFKAFGWHSEAKSRGYKVNENDLEKFTDNPFHSLKRYSLNSKRRLLQNEPIFLEALSTRNVALYWQYLEAIIPTKDNNDKQVIDIASHLLLLNSEKYFKDNLRHTIVDSIHPFATTHDNLSISKERQQYYFDQIFKNGQIDFHLLQSEVDHPFINDLLHDYLRPFRKNDFLIRKQFYERVLWETQGQRNSIVHNGFGHDKALISLDTTLTRIIMRLRIVLFNGIRRRVSDDYEDIVAILRREAQALLTP